MRASTLPLLALRGSDATAQQAWSLLVPDNLSNAIA
jgi:hypothetical protein